MTWSVSRRKKTQCDVCQKQKASQAGPLGLMGKRVVERPWAVVAADIMGPFPPSRQRFRYILVFQDCFTQWIEVKPLRSADGKTIACAFEDLVLFRWETPNYYLIDYGTEFINKVLAKTLETYGVKQIMR